MFGSMEQEDHSVKGLVKSSGLFKAFQGSDAGERAARVLEGDVLPDVIIIIGRESIKTNVVRITE